MFLAYLETNDFVGADMARKFLQMGFTRARRYANHRGGRKYDRPVPTALKGQSGAHGRLELPRSIENPVKARAAEIFKARLAQAEAEPKYAALKLEHKKLYD